MGCFNHHSHRRAGRGVRVEMERNVSFGMQRSIQGGMQGNMMPYGMQNMQNMQNMQGNMVNDMRGYTSGNRNYR